jgi:tripartite-type tricarboxylate transporter receptor subunit TctC
MKRISVVATLTLCATTITAFAAAPPYPSKPIRIIAASSAGSGPDIMARLLGQKLTDAWGQQVVVDIRTGASGMIGAEVAARANPDGYTFLIVTSQHAIVNNMDGLVAPAKTPQAIVSRVNAEVLKALGAADLQERMSGLGAEAMPGGPQALAAFMREQLDKMGKAVKESGARPDA